MPLKAPMPYYGGKARIASAIWEVLGKPGNYVEPFAGSLAVLLNRPDPPRLETVNDRDGFICNLWRAIQHDPETVAHYADWPSNENDLHARHAWLVGQREAITTRLEGDPLYYDAKVAGWYVWGACCWIGSGWCSGRGAWQVVDGQLQHLGNAGQGVQHQLPHLGDAGQGVQHQRPHLGQGGGGRGVMHHQAAGDGLYAWMQALCQRLRLVRVVCGDWTRVLGPSVTWKHGLTGVYLDPPYGHQKRTKNLYAIDQDVTREVQAWCLANGSNPLLRIVLSGYSGEYELPGWRQQGWTATAGYSGQNRDRDNQNSTREVLWLSPACLPTTQLSLFGGA